MKKAINKLSFVDNHNSQPKQRMNNNPQTQLFTKLTAEEASSVSGGVDGFLRIYKHDTWRHNMGQYNFSGNEEFRSWNDAQNDELSSFKYKLPVGWGLLIHRHRDPNSQYELYVGTGREEWVNKKDIPGFIHDDASGHSFVKL